MEKIFSFAWKGKRGLDLETPEGEGGDKENGENEDDSKKDDKNKAHVCVCFSCVFM